jgi:hypothetical protein
LSEKKSEHKNEGLRFGASNLVAAKAEERPLIEHNARQNANAPAKSAVIAAWDRDAGRRAELSYAHRVHTPGLPDLD